MKYLVNNINFGNNNKIVHIPLANKLTDQDRAAYLRTFVFNSLEVNYQFQEIASWTRGPERIQQPIDLDLYDTGISHDGNDYTDSSSINCTVELVFQDPIVIRLSPDDIKYSETVKQAVFEWLYNFLQIDFLEYTSGEQAIIICREHHTELIKNEQPWIAANLEEVISLAEDGLGSERIKFEQ